MITDEYDLIVIGAGPAGLAAAKTAWNLGKKVAIVEKQQLGGECLWTGCVPSKTLIYLAGLAYNAKKACSMGAHGSVEFDWQSITDQVKKTVKKVYETQILQALKHTDITILKGHAVFLDVHHIKVGHQTFKSTYALIATGSSPAIPTIEGLKSVAYLTNQQVFDLQHKPTSMIIVGAGAIGVELACAYNRLDITITLIANGSLLSIEDQEVSAILANSLANEGVIIATHLTILKISHHEFGVKVIGKDSAGVQHEFTAQNIMIATGRTPNVYQLGLENAGVRFNAQGLKVNQYLATTQPNIYACGDVVGPYRLSHMAVYQANQAVKNMFSLIKQPVDMSGAVWITFSAPEYASFGLTEDKARQTYGNTIKIYRASYDEIDRAYIDQTVCGMIKVICDRKGYIIGAHLLGARAGEIIHELNVARRQKMPLSQLYNAIHAYPSYSQIIEYVAKKAYEDCQSNKVVGYLKKILAYITKEVK